MRSIFLKIRFTVIINIIHKIRFNDLYFVEQKSINLVHCFSSTKTHTPALELLLNFLRFQTSKLLKSCLFLSRRVPASSKVSTVVILDGKSVTFIMFYFDYLSSNIFMRNKQLTGSSFTYV